MRKSQAIALAKTRGYTVELTENGGVMLSVKRHYTAAGLHNIAIKPKLSASELWLSVADFVKDTKLKPCKNCDVCGNVVTPNAAFYNESSDYLRCLINSSGLSQETVAKLIGIDGRTLRGYISTTNPKRHPYAIQYAIECLANA